jgi:UDP-glucose 4-epimerase
VRISGSRVLVTGGLGFIGSHVVRALLDIGAEVRVLDNYRSGVDENIEEVRSDVEVIRGDILNVEDLRHSLNGVDLVSHHAAQLEITRAIDNPIEDLTTNTIGTLRLLEECARANVERVIQATSAGVYGQAVSSPQYESSHPTDPNWAYGVSKLANEKYARIFHEVHGLDITSLRYAIVYGPREWYGRVLTIFLRRVLDNEPIVVFGDGEQVRDFVFVGDVVTHHLACIAHDVSENEIFNVSTGNPTTVNQLAETVKNVTESDVEIIHEDVPQGEFSKYLPRRRLPQELQSLVQSPQKSRELLQWEPKIALSDGLKSEWEWLLSHQHRWIEMAY